MTLPAAPIPNDLPLPLPAPEPLLIALLVISFLVHLLFVNLMVGGVLFTFFFQWLGLNKPAYNQLAYEIAKTITVNKSLAVVIGVAPLLLINVLYTVYFHTANALTGIAWILVIPLVSIAFLLLYLHKYAWHSLSRHKGLHLAILGLSLVIFLGIPLIFLTNINLMLFPDRWIQVKGFFSALMLPNVWPRYFHFIAASLAVTSLFLVWWLKRSGFSFTDRLPGLDRNQLLRFLYTVALAVSAAQFLMGPLILFTLPSHGLSLKLLGFIGAGAATAIPAMFWMWREINEDGSRIGRRWRAIATALGCTVILMVSGRHLYRDKALAGHQQAMAQKTQTFVAKAANAQAALVEGVADNNPDTAIDGQKAFLQICAGCHQEDKRLVGPSLTLIRKDYDQDVAGIVAWAKAPGRRRDDYPPMPPIMLPDDELEAIAAFILKTQTRSH